MNNSLLLFLEDLEFQCKGQATSSHLSVFSLVQPYVAEFLRARCPNPIEAISCGR